MSEQSTPAAGDWPEAIYVRATLYELGESHAEYAFPQAKNGDRSLLTVTLPIEEDANVRLSPPADAAAVEALASEVERALQFVYSDVWIAQKRSTQMLEHLAKQLTAAIEAARKAVQHG